MTVDHLKEKESTKPVDRTEDISSDASFLYPAYEERDVQPENPTDAKEGCSTQENELVCNWEAKLENNLAEKLGMAFELLEIGLSEETIDRILNLKQEGK